MQSGIAVPVPSDRFIAGVVREVRSKSEYIACL